MGWRRDPPIDPEKRVGVLTVLSDSGGRDISDIALVRKEAEVLMLPGSVFEVVSIDAVDGSVLYALPAAEASQKKIPLPTRCYVVKVQPKRATARRERRHSA